jgi:hypothetical protein
MGIDGLERLEAWKKSESFAVRIYQEVLPLSTLGSLSSMIMLRKSI